MNCFLFKNLFLFLFFCLLVGLASCDETLYPSGERYLHRYPISQDFHSIDASDRFELRISTGDTTVVDIDADRNHTPYFRVYVKDETLFLKVEEGIKLYTSTGPILVHIKMKEIRRINLSLYASAIIEKLEGENTIHVSKGDLRIDTLLSSRLELKLAQKSTALIPFCRGNLLDLSAAEESVLTAGGQMDMVTLNMYSEAVFDAKYLAATKMEAVLCTYSKAFATATESLFVKLSGNSEFNYWGNPMVTTDISSGRIHHKD